MKLSMKVYEILNASEIKKVLSEMKKYASLDSR